MKYYALGMIINLNMEELKMKKDFIIIFLLCLLFIFVGCDIVNYENHNLGNQGITINEYFNTTITNYSQKTISIEIDCLSGECMELKQDEKVTNKTHIKNCYFCDSSKIVNNVLELITSKTSSGGADFSFGCSTKNYGPEINGLEITYKDDTRIIVVGDIKYYKTKTSSSCDKQIDPECNSQVYGKCSEDYDAVIIYTTQMTFEK
jgi:hypothetical protein